MPNVTGTNNLYPDYVLQTFRGGLHEPETHSLQVGLLRISYTFNAGHMDLADVSADEVSGINGYSRQVLQNVSITNDGQYIRLNADPVVFSAVGGNFSAFYWFLFNQTAVNFPLMAYGQIDDTRSDEIVVVDGRTVTVTLNDLGLYRVPV